MADVSIQDLTPASTTPIINGLRAVKGPLRRPAAALDCITDKARPAKINSHRRASLDSGG